MNEILNLLLLLSISIFFIWLYAYKKYQVDHYRQDIFEIRDSLFDYAADGGIAFDHPAYTMARTYLNGTIRYTERLSFLLIVNRNIALRQYKSHFDADFENRLKGLTKNQREFISKALDKAVTRTVVYLVSKNILFIFFAYLVMCHKLIKMIFNYDGFKEKIKQNYKSQYSDAVYDEGEQHLRIA